MDSLSGINESSGLTGSCVLLDMLTRAGVVDDSAASGVAATDRLPET